MLAPLPTFFSSEYQRLCRRIGIAPRKSKKLGASRDPAARRTVLMADRYDCVDAEPVGYKAQCA